MTGADHGGPRRAAPAGVPGGAGPGRQERLPGLLLAWGPAQGGAPDRAVVADTLVVGRSAEASWSVRDSELSGCHFQVRRIGARLLARDLDSTNGTAINGSWLMSAREVEPGDVLRAGGCIFLVHPDPLSLPSSAGAEALGLGGPFHGGTLAACARAAALGGRHLLLEGPAGSGKEQVARAVAAALGRRIVAHGAARLGPAVDPAVALFGVAAGVFPGARDQPGLLEQTEGGMLYLEEATALPPAVQQGLARFAWDGVVRRVGETRGRRVDVRLALGIDLPFVEALATGRLAPELAGPLPVLRVPSLAERRADVPALFAGALRGVLDSLGIDPAPALAALRTDDLEALTLLDLSARGVRELEDLAATIAGRLRSTRASAESVIHHAVLERHPESPVFRRIGIGVPGAPADETRAIEARRQLILAAFREVGGDLARLESVLRARGVPCSRRWLGIYLERWGEQLVRPRRGRQQG
jgi:hypothetical protein